MLPFILLSKLSWENACQTTRSKPIESACHRLSSSQVKSYLKQFLLTDKLVIGEARTLCHVNELSHSRLAHEPMFKFELRIVSFNFESCRMVLRSLYILFIIASDGK
jgi:hypothetical protein